MPTGTALLLSGLLLQLWGPPALAPVRKGGRPPYGALFALLSLLLAHSFRLPLGRGWVNAGSLLLLPLFFWYSAVFRPKPAALGMSVGGGVATLFALAPYLAESEPAFMVVAVALAGQVGGYEEAVSGGALAVWGMWSSLYPFRRFAWAADPSPFAFALLGIWSTVLLNRMLGAALGYLGAKKRGRLADAKS